MCGLLPVVSGSLRLVPRLLLVVCCVLFVSSCLFDVLFVCVLHLVRWAMRAVGCWLTCCILCCLFVLLLVDRCLLFVVSYLSCSVCC